MIAYVVGKSLHAPAMDFFHYLMFHGQEVEEEPYCRAKGSFLGDDYSKQPYLVRNANEVPQVFEPHLLVVSEEVMNRLRDMPHVAFNPVCFHKVVDFPVYRPGDFSFKQDEEFQKVLAGGKIEEFLDRLPDVPAIHGSLGRYYELVVARLRDLAPRYSVRPIKCVMPMAVGWQEEFLLSAELLNDYPIVWSGWTVFNAEAFARISPFLDRDYFEVAEIEV